MKKFRVLFVFLLLCVSCSSGYEGYLFFLNFMNLTTDLIKNSLTDKSFQEIFISGEPGTKVIIRNLKKNTKEVKTFSSNQSFYLRLDDELGGNNLATFNSTIVVSAIGGPISVQGNKATRDSGAGYLALPLSDASTEYYLASYTLTENLPSVFSISAVVGGTCLDIFQFGKDGSRQRINHFSLDEGQVFHGQIDGDITGFYISSSKPIAVYSGHICIKVPVGRLHCDHIFEQIVPVKEWGKVHFASSLNGIPWIAGYIIRVIVAKQQTVTLTIINYSIGSNAPTSQNTNITEAMPPFIEYYIKGNTAGPSVSVIECPGTCLVMQYCTGSVNETLMKNYTSKPDPFMMTVPSIDHYPQNVHFSTSSVFKNVDNANYEVVQAVNFATVIIKKSQLARTLFDGLSLLTANAGTISVDFQYNSETYSMVTFPLNDGFHSVTSWDSTVFCAVYIYGYGTETDSSSKPTGYGYLGGYRYTYGNAGSLINSGPWFDPSPLTSSPSINSSDPSSPDFIGVTLADIPNEVTIWNTSFCTIYPLHNIIRRKCGEGYRDFFLRERISFMEKTLLDVCINATINLTLLPWQYSEYTCGHIYILVKVTGINEASMRTISDCTDSINTILTPLMNWMEKGTYQIDKVIDTSSDPNIEDCAPVHFKSNEMFIMRSRGWTCPQEL